MMSSRVGTAKAKPSAKAKIAIWPLWVNRKVAKTPSQSFWRIVKRRAQELGRGRRIAPAREPGGDDAVEPAWIAADEEISDERGAKGQDHAKQSLAPHRPDRFGPAAGEEAGDLPMGGVWTP